ncbi:MAG: nitroreductase family protein [Phycisphaerae bacterium]
MDVYEAITRRCSVRTYENRPIDPEVLERILQAGALAPSARNRQEWKFIVVQDQDLRSQIAREACEQPWMERAAVTIAVVGTAPDYVMYCGVPADPVDCAIAIDHMSLAATAEGLGTCWIGHFDQDNTRRLLEVPDNLKIIELLIVGHPAAFAEAAKPRKSLQQIVCYDRFF